MTTKIPIPSLDLAIKDAKSVPEVVRNQIELLAKRNSQNSVDLKIFANKLNDYYLYITDRDLLARQREHFNSFYDEIEKAYPNLLFRLGGRRKSFLSAYKKLWSTPSDTPLKDISAFRITLFGDDPVELIGNCYIILEHLFWYSIKRGFIPCIADTPKDIDGFSSSKLSDIIVPEKELLNSDLKPYVKDYISTPKKNGYQSLHIIFKDKKQNYFEVQIRTIYMHMIAENGDASHERHKEKYAHLNIDRESINIPGYYIQDDILYDWVGFEESLEILRRQKTY